MHLLILTQAELPPPDCPGGPCGLEGGEKAPMGGRGRGEDQLGVLGRGSPGVALGLAIGLWRGGVPRAVAIPCIQIHGNC